MMTDNKAIVTENLARVFRFTTGIIHRQTKEKVALKNVNLEVERGELFGLLGPNGAGKTTITKILSTILLPTGGCARVLGHDVAGEAVAIRPRIGIIFGGDRGLYWRLSGRDNIQYFADLYKVPPATARQRIRQLLALVGLTERADERVENYSHGMRQRLHIARGLVSDPDLIFMDEPTLGLDPVVAREVRDVIRNLQAAGKTIFLTSHYMFEVEALCNRVAVLNKGECLLIDTPAALKRLVADLEVVEITVSSVSEQIVEQLGACPRVDSVAVDTHGQTQVIHVHAHGASAHVQEFLELLGNTRAIKVVTREPTLEDAYVKLVGKEALEL
jgi:ABC-2 type transport system ATP-binding protein